MSVRSGRPGTRLVVATDEFRGPVLVREDGPVTGPVLVLLHGFCGSNGWYDRVVAELADTYRLVRLDLLGHGGTGGHAADAPMQAHVVEAVLEKLAVRRATVVGHSFGGDVAVDLAERSARIERLVIVCQGPDYTDVNLPQGKELMTKPVLANVLHGAGRVAAAGLGAVFAVRPPKDAASRLLAKRALADFRAVDTAMFGIVIDDRRDRLARRPLDEQLLDAGKPTLVVLGGKDHFYGARPADRYRAVGARVEIIDESGHSPLVEHPQLLARWIREFVSDGAAAVPSPGTTSA